MHPDMTQELPQIMKKVRIKKEYSDTITMYQAFRWIHLGSGIGVHNNFKYYHLKNSCIQLNTIIREVNAVYLMAKYCCYYIGSFLYFMYNYTLCFCNELEVNKFHWC